jgi:hypothetical protein
LNKFEPIITNNADIELMKQKILNLKQEIKVANNSLSEIERVLEKPIPEPEEQI